MRLVCLAWAVSLTGCASRDLSWEVAFSSASLEATVARLDARILSGVCPGTEVLWDQTIHPDDADMDPPRLPEGTYCLAARAGSAGCEWIAAGEQTVALPTDARIVVTVAASAPESNCPTGVCQVDGTCSAGPPEATLNCLTGNCEQACTSDCTATCVGGGCRQTCTGGVTTECGFSCTGGGCTVVCQDGADCNASCDGSGCDFACRGNTTDCTFGCNGGDCTFVCDDPADCMTSCSLDCTGP
jgi:hypothetical protein